jgi:hypothetical protein
MNAPSVNILRVTWRSRSPEVEAPRAYTNPLMLIDDKRVDAIVIVTPWRRVYSTRRGALALPNSGEFRVKRSVSVTLSSARAQTPSVNIYGVTQDLSAS